MMALRPPALTSGVRIPGCIGFTFAWPAETSCVAPLHRKGVPPVQEARPRLSRGRQGPAGAAQGGAVSRDRRGVRSIPQKVRQGGDWSARRNHASCPAVGSTITSATGGHSESEDGRNRLLSPRKRYARKSVRVSLLSSSFVAHAHTLLLCARRRAGSMGAPEDELQRWGRAFAPSTGMLAALLTLRHCQRVSVCDDTKPFLFPIRLSNAQVLPALPTAGRRTIVRFSGQSAPCVA